MRDSETTPPDTTTPERLRERVQAAWNDSEAACARCQHCDRQLNAVLAALAGDPGDLPAQTAEAIGAAIEERDASERPGDEYGPMTAHFAAAAMSVRWEHAVQQAAENEALRAELAKTRADLGEALSVPTLGDARAEIGGLRLFLAQHKRGAAEARRDDDIRYAAIVTERDALKATVKSVEALRDIWSLLPGFREEADALDAALDAPHAPADARKETGRG